jgi:ABC-type molybdate transport system permease subunit
MKEKMGNDRTKKVKVIRDPVALRPAFEEIWVYPFAVLGVFCAPILAAATEGKKASFTFDWAAFVIALVITAVMVVISEMRGTKEQKRVSRIRLSRYAFAFLLGIFWRLVVPMVEQAIGNMLIGG